MGAIVLTDEDLEKIGLYVKRHIGTWLEEENLSVSVGMITISERLIHIEEGLKAQGVLLEKLMNQIDKRFEQVDRRFEQVEKRFEQVDKRFQDTQHTMDTRFSQLQWVMGLGFTILAALMGIFNFF